MEFLGVMAGGFGLFLVLKITLAIIVSIAFPVFWIWMLVDAFLRPERDYPSKSSDEKLIWILAIVFVHVASIPYFLLVMRKAQRTPAPVTAHYTVAA